MRIKTLFKGDYATEFGGESRRWRTFGVYDKGRDIGRIEQEPADYHYPFRAYNTPAVIGGNYVGQFKSLAEAMSKIKTTLCIK